MEEHRRLVIRPLKYDMDDADAMLGCLGLENPHRGQNNVKTIALKKTSAKDVVKTLPKDPKSDDYMKLLESHFSNYSNGGWGGVSLLEVHNSNVVEAGVLYIMACLKIMVAGSRPWWVNSTYSRLVRPLSSRL